MRPTGWKSGVGAALLFVALTIVLTYPLSLRPASSSLPLGPDGDLFMWTLAWNTHAFTHQPWAIFDANIYYPEPNTLAYSENLIGSAFFAAPVLWATGDPVLALNIVELLTCVMCGIGAFLLARQLGISPFGAVLCGIVFAFSPPRFFRTGQLHLGAVQWIPFALASAHAYLDEGRTKHLRLLALFVTLQALSSGHGIVFLGLALLLLAVYRVATGERVAILQRVRDLGITGALLALPVVLVFLPYRRVQKEMGLRRTLENWAIDPESFLASPTHVQTWLVSLVAPGAKILVDAQAFLFPGYLPVLLAAAVLFWRPPRERDGRSAASRLAGAARGLLPILLEFLAVASLIVGLVVLATGPLRLRSGGTVVFSAREPWRALVAGGLFVALRAALLRRFPLDLAGPWRRLWAGWTSWSGRNRRSVTVFYGLLTLLSVLLSIGPPLGLWPLVYWMPGLNFIRVPSRFTILAVLGLAVLAGVGFDRLSARFAPRRRLALAVVVAFLLVVEFAAVPLVTIPNDLRIPEADRWLASRPAPFAVAELPLPERSSAGAFARSQSAYMLHSMAHWQKTVHGHSGFQSPFHDRLFDQMRQFPDEDALRGLAAIGVSYIVIHTDLYEPGEWDRVRARIDDAGAWLRLEHVAGAGRVYSLHAPGVPQG